MADQKLTGQNYTTPDLVAKVTGRARYAEDYRVDGMLFAKLLLSPMPHARVKNIDLSAALAMPGVKGILTEADLPGAAAGATLGEGVTASQITERGLTMTSIRSTLFSTGAGSCQAATIMTSTTRVCAIILRGVLHA